MPALIPLLVILALIVAVLSAIGKAPLWPSVVLVCVALLVLTWR